MNLRHFQLRKSTIAGALLGVVVGWAAVVAFNSYTFNPKRWVKLRARSVAEAYIGKRATEKVPDGHYTPRSASEFISDDYIRARNNARRLDSKWFIPWYLDATCYQAVYVGRVDVYHSNRKPDNWSAVAYLSVVRRRDGFSSNVDEVRMDIEIKPDRTVSEKVVGSFLGDTWSFKSYEIRADRTPIQMSPLDRLRQYVLSFLP
jgi:hypothetical protein